MHESALPSRLQLLPSQEGDWALFSERQVWQLSYVETWRQSETQVGTFTLYFERGSRVSSGASVLESSVAMLRVLGPLRGGAQQEVM